jgi:hypothetical protein
VQGQAGAVIKKLPAAAQDATDPLQVALLADRVAQLGGQAGRVDDGDAAPSIRSSGVRACMCNAPGP